MYRYLKRRTFEIVETTGTDSLGSRIFDSIILSLIFFNILALVLETVDEVRIEFSGLFSGFEQTSLTVFTIEYLLRLWCCTTSPHYRHPVWGRLRWMVTPLAIVDLIAVLPFYLAIALGLPARSLITLRAFRFFRVFKAGRYFESLHSILRVFYRKREALYISLMTVLILLLIASSLMYLIEHNAQPEAFGSIPATLWWGISTLTTVSYGDVYPITPLGRFLGGIVSILGIGLFALPTSILASGFTEEFELEHESQDAICPHCGKNIHTPADRTSAE
ncbi:ion transporter [Egbenema bharatensis]|uniref:ion transporter n=1 Tax=Egbenema bharatensis TaxID=3463334 RepID=UPI003A84E44B